MSRKRKPEAVAIDEDVEELSPETRKELRRRLADSRDPVRYVVYTEFLPDGRWRLFLNVSDDTYCDRLDAATLFKREQVALAVAKLYSDGRRRDLLVAKITTRNGRRRVLKYERTGPRTKPGKGHR